MKRSSLLSFTVVVVLGAVIALLAGAPAAPSLSGAVLALAGFVALHALLNLSRGQFRPSFVETLSPVRRVAALPPPERFASLNRSVYIALRSPDAAINVTSLRATLSEVLHSALARRGIDADGPDAPRAVGPELARLLERSTADRTEDRSLEDLELVVAALEELTR